MAKKQYLYITGFSLEKGSLDIDTLSHTKKDAIKKIVEDFGNKHTWRQLKNYGRKIYKLGEIK